MIAFGEIVLGTLLVIGLLLALLGWLSLRFKRTKTT